MKRRSLALLLICLLAVALQNNTRAQMQSVVIPGTQVLKLPSAIVGQEYRLDIHLPSNYDRDSSRHYPVVYLLDGQWDFPIVNGIYGSQYYDGFLPEFILVGITWGGTNPNIDSLRTRDFTPTHVADQPQSGGGPNFLAFIKKEMIPFISSKYRVTDDRTLMGTSLSGLFTLYALFADPSLFHRYVLTSPSVWWDRGVLNSFEKKYEESTSSQPARLYMGKGQLEDDLPAFQQFAAHLKAKKIKGLELHTQVIENTGHSGTTAEGFSRGLQSVFERPSLQLAPSVLSRYTGTYQFETIKVQLSQANGKLIAVTPETKYLLQAATKKDFYAKGTFINVHFQLDDSGKVSGFQLEQFEGGIFMKKVK